MGEKEKEIMKRQLIQFGVIIGVLLLCAGGYFLMTNYFADKKAEEEKADTTQAFKIDDYTKITGITYSYNDEMIILLKEGDKWILGPTFTRLQD